MSNSRDSGLDYEDAFVDTDPSSPGYFTNNVKKEQGKLVKDEIWFSVRANSSFDGTVTLQFKTSRDSDFFDYDTFLGNDRINLNINAGTEWRAGVKDGEISAGEVTFGFDW